MPEFTAGFTWHSATPAKFSFAGMTDKNELEWITKELDLAYLNKRSTVT